MTPPITLRVRSPRAKFCKPAGTTCNLFPPRMCFTPGMRSSMRTVTPRMWPCRANGAARPATPQAGTTGETSMTSAPSAKDAVPPGRMPVLFVGHGNPMNAIERNDFHRSWEDIARRLPKPKAILCVSAHWGDVLNAASDRWLQPTGLGLQAGIPRWTLTWRRGPARRVCRRLSWPASIPPTSGPRLRESSSFPGCSCAGR
jgi:hypothetical protein